LVRKAFCSEPGKSLIVSDYGQLELRLLAHMAECQSMMTAFELGGVRARYEYLLCVFPSLP
jgi:DNA polymerase-1